MQAWHACHAVPRLHITHIASIKATATKHDPLLFKTVHVWRSTPNRQHACMVYLSAAMDSAAAFEQWAELPFVLQYAVGAATLTCKDQPAGQAAAMQHSIRPMQQAPKQAQRLVNQYQQGEKPTCSRVSAQSQQRVPHAER